MVPPTKVMVLTVAVATAGPPQVTAKLAETFAGETFAGKPEPMTLTNVTPATPVLGEDAP